jgi:acetyl-CoA C-acetyltransferase
MSGTDPAEAAIVSGLDPATPVLVGWAAVEQREKDHQNTLDAAGLMIKATKSVLPEDLAATVFPAVDWIGTTDGLTHYPDPARLVADEIGAENAHTVVAKVGVMQQTLVSQACSRVQHGESVFALIAAGEARYRDVRASAVGASAELTPQAPDVTPDEVLIPASEYVLRCEQAAGLSGAPGFYALIESEWRARHSQSLGDHRVGLGELYSRFTEIAADNPHATRRQKLSAAYLSDPSAENPMLAYPYTKLMVTTWTVDQASALLFCTVATAEKFGIPRERWLFPLVAAESNHIVPVAARRELMQSAAMTAMARASREATGVDTSAIELVDVYSCFPVAARVAAEGLGIGAGRDLTVTGGMAFAGGPYNNYVFQAMARAADLLESGAGRTALVSCVSGLYTKQGFTVLSVDPPTRPFAVVDVTEELDRAEPPLPTEDEPSGTGQVIAYTVMFDNDGPERAIAVIDLPNGHRTVALSQDSALIDELMTHEAIGREVTVAEGTFSLQHRGQSVNA